MTSTQLLTAQQPSEIKDPLYNRQWHLKNTGQSFSIPAGTPGEDINVESVWQQYKGEGTYISIVDGDIKFNHEDLIDNVSTQHSVDYHPGFTSTLSHGTRVAGVAAARDNTLGVRGVAPRAKIYSLNLLGDTNTGRSKVKITNLVDAMRRHSSITAVSNNSWGYEYPFNPSGSMATMWQSAIENGISNGFYGKGTVYVFAAGNDHCRSTICHVDNANYDGLANYHATIAVCSVDNRGRHMSYSEFGANLWLCAPSGGIVTTDVDNPSAPPSLRENRYAHYFRGTSASAPMVSGVVALMRQANPNLSWRDVKLILANSARQNDATDSSWMPGAVKYDSFPTNADRKYQFSHKYGFGVVNAAKAIELAENWLHLPPREPDAWGFSDDVQVVNSTATSSLSIQSNINFIEYLDIHLEFMHGGFNDLRVRLTSPSGNFSELVTPSSAASTDTKIVVRGVRGKWWFGSARHLGEDPSGTWTLSMEDTRDTTGTLVAWRLRVRGYESKMDAVAAKQLSEADIRNDAPNKQLTLSLSGTQWKDDLDLQGSDFRLKNAPPGLRVERVSRTSDTVVKLQLQLDQGFAGDYRFQVEATTGTISGRAGSLLSNDIAIFSNKPKVRQTILAPDGAVGSDYEFIIDKNKTFASMEELTYRVDGLDQQSGLDETITADSIRISGMPTSATIYHVTITATTHDGDSTKTSFSLRVRPAGYPIVSKPIRSRLVFANEEIMLELNKIFADSEPGGSTLTYTIIGNPNWLRYTTETAVLSGTADRTATNGRYKITISAIDTEGRSTDTIFNMEVIVRLYIRPKVFLESVLK